MRTVNEAYLVAGTSVVSQTSLSSQVVVGTQVSVLSVQVEV